MLKKLDLDFDGLIEYGNAINTIELSFYASLMLQVNDTVQARYTVKRGSGRLNDLGCVLSVNSERMLNVFKEDERCNVFNGTEKTLFPPMQKKHEVVWTYSNDACKSFPLRFKYMTKLRHINTAYKSALFTDPLVKIDSSTVILLPVCLVILPF